MLAELPLARSFSLWRSAPRVLARRTPSRGLASLRSVATRRFLLTAPASAALYMMFQKTAMCSEGTADAPVSTGGNGDEEDPVADLIEKYGPVGGQLGFGWLAGFVSGYALKRIGQKVAFALGVIFLGAQILAYNGIIDIQWAKIQENARKRLDTDGDGDLDRTDLLNYWNKLKDISTYNFPAGGGYAVGFGCGIWML